MSIVNGLIRWARKHESSAFVEKVVKPVGRMFLAPGWKKREKAFFSTLVEKGDLVFDVGAHTGDKAKLLLDLGAKVVCIEPQPGCVDELRKRYTGHKDVSIIAKGVGSEPGEFTMYICSEMPMLSTLVEDWGDTAFQDKKFDKKVTVEVTTLDAIIAEHGMPKFAKIDVEGFEQEVLKGLSHPVPQVSVEFNKDALERTLETLDYLGQMGYKTFNASLGETAQYVFSDWVSLEDMKDYMRKPVDETLWAWGDVYARR